MQQFREAFLNKYFKIITNLIELVFKACRRRYACRTFYRYQLHVVIVLNMNNDVICISYYFAIFMQKHPQKQN